MLDRPHKLYYNVVVLAVNNRCAVHIMGRWKQERLPIYSRFVWIKMTSFVAVVVETSSFCTLCPQYDCNGYYMGLYTSCRK